jgi:hypothetical protein
MQRSRWQSKSFRRAFRAGFCALWLGAACGGNPELANNDQGIDGLAGVGEACTDDSDCQESLECGPEGVCVVATDASCHDDDSCPPDPDDPIVIGIGGASSDGSGGDGAGGVSSCIDVDVDFTPQIPTVLLLIDRSGSMNADGKFGDAVQAAVDAGTYTLGDCPKDNDWRWNVVRDVLMSPTKGIVKPLENGVRFGLSLYSSNNGQVKDGKPEEIDDTKMCPVLLNVDIALGNHQAMLDQFKCNDISEDTPTGESLLAAAATLKAFQEPGPKVIVLATDGEPDSCECPDFGNGMPAKCREPGVPELIKEHVVATAKEIHDADITVHVINVSTPSEANLQKHLADVAEAGGGNVYPGFSPGDLSTAFDEIINGVRSCVIDLSGEIAKGKESTGVITLDGEALELDGADGWQVNTPSQIELLGDACETIKSGGHDLSIKFPCESFEPVVH